MGRLRRWLNWKVRLAIWACLVLGTAGAVTWLMWMPGRSFRGELGSWSDQEQLVARELKEHVRALAETIGPRNAHTLLAQRQVRAELEAAADYVEGSLEESGYSVQRQAYQVKGHGYANLEAVRPGRIAEVVVVGAHYDSFPGTPGADDNASGVAALLVLARLFRDVEPDRELRFVAFTNEEPYFFQTEDMGSLVYARRCKERNETVVAMLSLETMGYYTDRSGAQHYPFPLGFFYPDTGDFVAFVGDLSSRPLLHRCLARFRGTTRFPSEGASLPAWLPGVGWSDHWAFWQVGYPALMVTDTAPFRNPHYHQPEDTWDRLDYPRMSRVVLGLREVITGLASADARR
ncbi:MAG: M28 family peptidase [Candidatus Eremiobacterota bacterium]